MADEWASANFGRLRSCVAGQSADNEVSQVLHHCEPTGHSRREGASANAFGRPDSSQNASDGVNAAIPRVTESQGSHWCPTPSGKTMTQFPHVQLLDLTRTGPTIRWRDPASGKMKQQSVRRLGLSGRKLTAFMRDLSEQIPWLLRNGDSFAVYMPLFWASRRMMLMIYL